MTILKDILYKVSLETVVGNTNVGINNIRFDSRKVEFNDLFVTIRGTQSDGHDFIEKATENGALAIICEELPKTQVNGITYIKVDNSQSALAVMASNFYGNPSENLKLIGITGTNGKTTIASLLYQLFKKAGFKVGLISTVEILVDDER
ncbi:MAG TPA: Mur ligase domain-containing protein, partial [Salinimicrobium sp.]|nr:Mur ligase domain-containing protein [Salinimicrobium sp.]